MGFIHLKINSVNKLFVRLLYQYTVHFKGDHLSLWYILLFPALQWVGRIFNTKGTQNTWENQTKPNQQLAQQQNASHLWHEAEQLLANEAQHYTTVKERKQRTPQHPFVVVGETHRNRMWLARLEFGQGNGDNGSLWKVPKDISWTDLFGPEGFQYKSARVPCASAKTTFQS